MQATINCRYSNIVTEALEGYQHGLESSDKVAKKVNRVSRFYLSAKTKHRLNSLELNDEEKNNYSQK